MNLAKDILDGNRRSVARLISFIENQNEKYVKEIKKLFPYTGSANTIGITGPPGTGKSTITDKIVKKLVKKNYKVGVIAVDPTSPFTGGAILGDRVRMTDLTNNPNVFIRSMGSRGSLGGIAKATWDAVTVLDAFGMDYIFIETVGVGQTEIDIVKMVDTTIMITMPGMGDDIQAFKAGIMEIGDIFVINKADHSGAEKTYVEIENMINNYSTLNFPKHGIYDTKHLINIKAKKPPIIKAEAINDIGIDMIVEEMNNHLKYLETNELLQEIRERNINLHIYEIIKNRFFKDIYELHENVKEIKVMIPDILSGKLDYYSAANIILDKWREGNGKQS